jgi:crotonobetainyl-CoA:carnitine CoA-transferase CaiB-like acyl-CoA transferase
MLSDPDTEEPLPQRPAIGDAPTGIALAAGILAALIQVGRTGKGVEVNTSLFNAGLWTLGPDIAYASLTGKNPQRRAPGEMGAGPLGSRYRTADGRVVAFVMTNEPRYWPRACRAMGLDHLIEEYPDPEERLACGPVLRERFAEIVTKLTADEIAGRLRAEDCVFAFINSPVDALNDPAALANGYLLSHPTNPALRLPAIPAQFDDQLPAMRRGGPDLGEHSDEILRELGYTGERINELIAEGTIGPINPPPSR